MIYYTDHHGINMPSVGIGTWAIGGPYWTEGEPTGWGGPLDDDDSATGLSKAVAGGLTHIDTADVYGYGRSERIVARAMASFDREVAIATKVGFVGTSAPSVFSPENIRFQCEQSLRNLGLDAVDVYYLHDCDFGDDDIFLSGAIDEVRRLKADGLTRSIGLSGYSAEDLIRVASALEPDFIQSWASIEHPEFIVEDGRLAQFMMANDIRFVAMMPFGQGRLLGKYDPSDPPTFEAGDNRLDNVEFTGPSLAQLEPKVQALRERFGPEPSDLIAPALGFVLRHPCVVTVIPGFRNSNQVQGLLTALDRPYTSEDHAFVQDLFPFDPSNVHPWA